MADWIVHFASNALLLGFIYFFDVASREDFRVIALCVFASNLIDVDHLLASPVYDPSRCSINFHPLHSWYFFPVYVALLFVHSRRVRYFVAGVFLHLALDWLWCLRL